MQRSNVMVLSESCARWIWWKVTYVNWIYQYWNILSTILSTLKKGKWHRTKGQEFPPRSVTLYMQWCVKAFLFFLTWKGQRSSVIDPNMLSPCSSPVFTSVHTENRFEFDWQQGKDVTPTIFCVPTTAFRLTPAQLPVPTSYPLPLKWGVEMDG